ncbi:ABC transporter ATP-binding protein [Actinopolymorpha sp. B11F2]|uniref:ABC transporter ATP-binding protein n=1 Tax=Actinopolymorpha sp. B11F2 TaxID=3160862 RepID=UPI0032E435FF
MPRSDGLLAIEGLKTHFFTDDGVVRAVDGVNLSLPEGKTVCVVGESGCGKSITARSILGLVESPGRVVDGHVWWRTDGAGTNGSAAAGEDRVDLAALDIRGEGMRKIRGNEISMVFQEPMASLSPVYTVANQLVEAIQVHLPLSKEEAWKRGIGLLERVGIPRPERTMGSYPFQLSGGMCQRVMIAIALACEPRLLIADEPTTALDVTTQARIIDLFIDIQRDTGMAMMFITHDLGVVAEIADEVIVMYLGTVVEQGGVDEIFHDPKHPYTRALLDSIPTMGRGVRQRLSSIRGQVPHPLDRPKGCPFQPRCDHAVPGLCDTVEPPTVTLADERRVRCVLHDPDLLRKHELRQATGVRVDGGEGA